MGQFRTLRGCFDESAGEAGIPMTRKRTTVITIETDEVVIRRFPGVVKTGRNREVSVETTSETEESAREKSNQEKTDV